MKLDNKIMEIIAFKSMLYVARGEGEPIDEKYQELEDELINSYDFDVTDMMDNLEGLYQSLKKGNESNG